jgi:hypothetical protein
MSVSLVEAALDPDLLGVTLPEPWKMQLEVFSMLENPDISLLMLVWGRGSSKTTLSAVAAIFEAALRSDLDGMLAPGRTRYVLAAAPGEEQSREFIRVCRGIIEASPVLRPMATISADRIDFTSASGARTAIRSLPCKAETVRGMSASMCICDEFAHFGRTEGSSSAPAMYEALDGSMVPFQNEAKTVLISTPKGTAGMFAEKFRDVQGGVLPRARAIQAATWDVRPDLTQEFLDRKRIELGEASFLQEYGAQFIDAGGSFFDTREFEFVGDSPARPEDASRWTASLDLAFHQDSTGVALVGPSREERSELVVGHLEAIVPGSRLRALTARRGREDKVLAHIARIIEPYAAVRSVSVVSDVHQADAVRSYFGRLGYAVRIETGAKDKVRAFESTRARLTDGSLRLWRHPGLVEEMRRVQARNESIVLPRIGDNHCDLIAALCQGVFQYRQHTGIPEGHPAAGPSHWSALQDGPLPVPGPPRRDRFGRPKSSLSRNDLRF